MTTDPIADLLTRIRNGARARKDVISVPSSIVKKDILKILKDKKFITDYTSVKKEGFEEIEVTLMPDNPLITLTRKSKPGQRIYVKSENIQKVNGGLGVAIISTSKGIMSGEQAQKEKRGGELMCEIYFG